VRAASTVVPHFTGGSGRNVEVVRELGARGPRLGEDTTPSALFEEPCRARPRLDHVEHRVKSAGSRFARGSVEKGPADRAAPAIRVDEQPADHTKLASIQSGGALPVGIIGGSGGERYVAHDCTLDLDDPRAHCSARRKPPRWIVRPVTRILVGRVNTFEKADARSDILVHAQSRDLDHFRSVIQGVRAP
jgi:hypothetical protein